MTLRNIIRTTAVLGILVAGLAGLSGCDDYGAGLGGFDDGWGYYDPGFGGYGPIDDDVFQASADAWDAYIRE